MAYSENPSIPLSKGNGPGYGAASSGLLQSRPRAARRENEVIVEDDECGVLKNDPHRDPPFEEVCKVRGSNWNAYVNVVCVVAGSGTLGVPYGIQQGGWISLAFLLLSATMTTYANIKLIDALYHDGKKRKLSISQVAFDAFGRLGLLITVLFFSALSIGCPILYLILSGDSLHLLFLRVGIDWGMECWVYVCAAVICVPFVCMKTMKEGAWLSMFGVLTAALVVLVVCVVSLEEYPNHHDSEHKFVDLRTIPLALATFSFSYGGNIVYPHIEASMKTPKAWPRVLTLAIASITLMYLLIGIPSYLTYGHQTMSPIYKNLPMSSPSVTITIVSITIHVLLALPIYLISLALEVEALLRIDIATLGKMRELVCRAAVRVALVSLAVYIAVTVPYFADWMELMGALGNGVLQVALPIAIWVKLHGWEALPYGKWEQLWIVFVVTFAVTAAVIGTCDAFGQLYKDIMNG